MKPFEPKFRVHGSVLARIRMLERKLKESQFKTRSACGREKAWKQRFIKKEKELEVIQAEYAKLYLANVQRLKLKI